MKLESKLWQRIRDCKANKSLFFQRIETSTGTGIPDLFWRFEGKGQPEGWAELKVVSKLIHDKSVKLDRKKFTMEQRNWLKTYHDKGGIVFLIIGVYVNENWEIFWIKGKAAYLFVEEEINELRKKAYSIGEKFPLVNS